ncbi:hypothetical protein ACVRZD_01500 [Streptococcus hongkongensis]
MKSCYYFSKEGGHIMTKETKKEELYTISGKVKQTQASEKKTN